MSSAKRRINSTGRKRIKRERIEIRMLEVRPGEPLKATASLQLSDLGFPHAARVAIEAYHRSSGMRFDCGTIHEMNIPPLLVLDEVDQNGAVLFRVKVVDTGPGMGKLLGSAERIQARSKDEAEGRRSLFPVEDRDLGYEVWKVEVDNDVKPVLILNNRIPSLKYHILENPLIQGVLLPAALRIVIRKLADDPAAVDDDESEWKQDWLRYCQEELRITGDPVIMNMDDRKDWVDEVVRRFCEQTGFVARIRKMIDGEEGNAAAA